MCKENIEDIIVREITGGELSPDESAQFDAWLRGEGNRAYYESLRHVHSGMLGAGAAGADRKAAWKRVGATARTAPTRRIMRYAAAVVILVCVGTGIFISSRSDAPVEIVPGGGKAVVTLDNGQQILFSGDASQVENSDGTRVVALSDNVIAKANLDALTSGPATDDNSTSRYRVEIPTGGFIELELPDGSRVWLNSESTLSYPRIFTGGRRVVELRGEGYFKVAHDDAAPFTVRTGDYDITVTGTEFNVNSYTAGHTATTLVEGGVAIEYDGTRSLLRADQQAVIRDGRIEISDVETTRYTAWREGAFDFNEMRLQEIMEQLSRWYGIEVVWADPQMKDYHFSAWFSRGSDFGAILDVLQRTKVVGLELRGTRLIISKL